MWRPVRKNLIFIRRSLLSWTYPDNNCLPIFVFLGMAHLPYDLLTSFKKATCTDWTLLCIKLCKPYWRGGGGYVCCEGETESSGESDAVMFRDAQNARFTGWSSNQWFSIRCKWRSNDLQIKAGVREKFTKQTKLTFKLDKVWAADFKTVFSFSAARTVFEMRRGFDYFHMKTGLKTLIYWHTSLISFYNWSQFGQRVLAYFL